mmetsp:Transcript_30408/g.67466  ORF Transcript_30408/g.67466 Transcript_30408/m.67466 type:complete len:97 (+) Transcript_30408:74-364(+)
MDDVKSFNDDKTVNATLHIQNATQGQVQLVWITFDGQENLYNVLDPEASVHQETFSTHVWRLKNEDGALLLQYSGPSAHLLISPEGLSVRVNPVSS